MEARLKEDILMEAARYACGSFQYFPFPQYVLWNSWHGCLNCLSKFALHDKQSYFLKWHNRYGNKILVTDELPDGQMVDQWESVSCNSVKAPLEVWVKLIYSGGVILLNDFAEQNAPKLFSWLQVYQELQVEGYLVDYERVPITDEKSPKERDFDILVSSCVLNITSFVAWQL